MAINTVADPAHRHGRLCWRLAACLPASHPDRRAANHGKHTKRAKQKKMGAMPIIRPSFYRMTFE
jgi:hypothetical protein